MNTFLEKILEQKRREVHALRGRSFSPRSSPRRPFVEALDERPHLAVIAEVKKASPSKGLICAEFDPVSIARSYEDGGAAAISVLTDEHFFQGHADYLVAVRSNTTLPVLRKDFIIDELQVRQTASINADAMLLIAEALDAMQLTDLFQAALGFDIDPLIELHSIRQLDKVLRVGPRCIGINNRDLSTFVTDIKTTIALIKEIPREVTVVAESGIAGTEQVKTLRDAGVRALLVGEALMREKNSSRLLAELKL